MELVAEASMCAGTIVRELCSKYHLAHLLIGTIRLCIIPQFLEVLAQWVGSNYLLAILDYSIQVGILVLSIPAIMQFRGTIQMSLCQEMGSSRLGKATYLLSFWRFRQQFVCLLEIRNNLSKALFLAVAGIGIINLTVAWLQLQRHTSILLYQLEISKSTEEVTLTQTGIVSAHLLSII